MPEFIKIEKIREKLKDMNSNIFIEDISIKTNNGKSNAIMCGMNPI